MTLSGLYFGLLPPPTIARIFHLKSIETIPIPPSKSLEKVFLKGSVLYILKPLSVPQAKQPAS